MRRSVLPKRVIAIISMTVIVAMIMTIVACHGCNNGKTEKTTPSKVTSSVVPSSVTESTAKDTPTPTSTDTPTPTETPVPTDTPTPTVTDTPTPTETPTPTSTPTPEPTSTPVPTVSPTPTNTPKPTKTVTPTPEPPPPTATPTPTQIPDPVPPPTDTPTPTPTTAPDPGKNLDSEYEAGKSHAQDLGYQVFFYDKSEHMFEFRKNNEYQGLVTVYATDDGGWMWSVRYFRSDHGDGYRYSQQGQNLIALLDGIDPSY